MNPGTLVLVKFPFTHLDTLKKRPALVLKTVALTTTVQILTVAMITSKTDGLRLEGDYLINDWKSASLLHPSLLRLSKVATIDLEIIDRELGQMTTADLKSVKALFKTFYRFWL